MRILRPAALLLAAAVLAAAGCARVPFNRRERLQDRDMTFDPDPLRVELEGHILQPREGATGCFAGGGAGGCGCD